MQEGRSKGLRLMRRVMMRRSEVGRSWRVPWSRACASGMKNLRGPPRRQQNKAKERIGSAREKLYPG